MGFKDTKKRERSKGTEGSATTSKGGKTKQPPKGWPPGVWHSKADNPLYDTAVAQANMDEAFRNFNGNKELEEQVALRIEHAETIAKLTKKASGGGGGKKGAKESPKSKIVFAGLNGIRTEMQRQERFLEEDPDDEAHLRAQPLAAKYRDLGK